MEICSKSIVKILIFNDTIIEFLLADLKYYSVKFCMLNRIEFKENEKKNIFFCFTYIW